MKVYGGKPMAARPGLKTVMQHIERHQARKKGGLQIKIKHPGRLHRELGVKVGTKIPASKIEAATHSKDPTVRRDAIRAKTFAGWKH